MITLTDEERRLITAILGRLRNLPHEEQEKLLGTCGVPIMYRLERKLHYYPYWSKHGIRFEDMTEDDYVDAYLEMA